MSALDLISFPDVNAKYLRIAKAYGGLSGAPTSFQTIGTISDYWTGAAMPVSGAGIYNGRSYAVLYEGSPFAEHYVTTSSVSLDVNFASHAVSGGLRDFQHFNAATGAPENIFRGLGVGFRGTISGDTVSGTMFGLYRDGPWGFLSSGFGASTSNSTTATLSGEFDGKFAGDTSGEFGGRFKVFGNDFLWAGALIATQTPTVMLMGPNVRNFDNGSSAVNSIANANVLITTNSDLSLSPWLIVSGAGGAGQPSQPYEEHFGSSYPTPISVPGVADVYYASGEKSLDWLSFSALSMSYVRLAKAVRSGTVTNPGNDTIIAAISDRWTGASMPLSGSATYTGFTYGTVDFVDASSVRNKYIATAPFSLSANFASRSVTGGATGYSLYDAATGAPVAPAPLAGLGVQFTGQISGDVVSSNNITTTSGGSGVLSGQFAGPDAAEIGGAYYTGNAQLTVRGAFLAKR